MDEIFGYMDGRFEVSLADSTMMWIVHHAMNRAQEKMKTKKGVLERLNEISKFYELAVMQLEGCLSIVRAETESSFLESNHEQVLDDLREIKDRLQGRLEESESVILDKDRELTMRLKNELQLRHALQLKERELVRNDGDLCELRTSMDQQMLNIKQRLEPQYHENIVSQSERQHGFLVSNSNNGNGNGNNDTKKIEEMGSDIDILKQTMDLAFGKMQSALFSCEMGPKERQWKLNIEKDVMCILIQSFMSEFEENIKAEARKNQNRVQIFWLKRWSQLMNEVISLKNELGTINETIPEDFSDSSALSSPTKPSSPQKSNEERDHKEGELAQEEEENENGSNYVAKMVKNHESIIRQKNEELNRIKHRILQEKKASSSKKRKELNSLKERIHIVAGKLNNLIKWNEKLGQEETTIDHNNDKETTFPMKKLSSSSSSQEYEIDHLEKLIHKCFLSEMMNEWNENIETNKFNQEFDEIESILKENICILVFRKSIEEFNKMMRSYKDDNTIRKHIDHIVFGETLKDFVNISSSVSIDHRKTIITHDNFQDNLSTTMMILNQVHKVEGQENLTIILLESLLSCFEAEENLMLSAHSEIKEHSKQLDLGSERGDLHEHELFEDLLTGEEEAFSSLTSKVENVLQQLGISKALLKELGTSLGHSLRDSESFHHQMLANDNEQGQFDLSSFESSTLAEFEAMVYQKLEIMSMRYVSLVIIN